MADEAVGGEAQIRHELDEEVTAVRVDRPEHGHDTTQTPLETRTYWGK